MDAVPEYSVLLISILEELDTKYSTVSYQELCKSLCARFELVHLAKLRSLLFYTACLDPSFPATLFKDKMRCSVEDQQSKKLMVAADIVTMFNLIQMNGGMAMDKLPLGHRAQKFQKNLSFESCRSDSDAYCKYNECDRTYDRPNRRVHRGLTRPTPECCQFVPSSEPNFLLGVSKDLKCRAASLDKLQQLPQYVPSPPPCEMQSTYFPMDNESESKIKPGNKDVFLPHHEPFSVHSCIQKRNIFRQNFHNLVAVDPKPRSRDDHRRRELHKPQTFFNHSFELPYSNPYFEPASSPIHSRSRVKHESLDDLQASTYFGPTTVTECANTRRTFRKPTRYPAWPIKSLSLNADEGQDFERSFLTHKVPVDDHVVENNQHCLKSTPIPTGFCKKSSGMKMKDGACGPSTDKRDAGKRYKDKSVNCPSIQVPNLDGGLNVGTQTDSEQKKRRDFSVHNKYKVPDEECELSDDISDIFRFLDDLSVCESLGITQSSCYNSNGSLSQITKSDAESSPELNTIKRGRSGITLDRLFSTLEGSDDELKASVCKLVLRMGEIEKKLESLSGVRGEISQVLSKLTRLDEKIQEPDSSGKAAGDAHLSPCGFQCHTTGHDGKVDTSVDWCCLDPGAGAESLRGQALRKNMFHRRSSMSLTEENGATKAKVTSITNSPRDWRTISYSSYPGDELKEQDRHGDPKDRHRKNKEVKKCQILTAYLHGCVSWELFMFERRMSGCYGRGTGQGTRHGCRVKYWGGVHITVYIIHII